MSRSTSAYPTDLRDILDESRHYNEPRGFTGALCFLDGVYLQYIEGSVGAVESLYHRIARDPRHVQPKVLEYKRIEQRLFAEWAMALVTWNDQTRAIFQAFNGPGRDLYAIEPAQAASTFEALARSANWQVVGRTRSAAATAAYSTASRTAAG